MKYILKTIILLLICILVKPISAQDEVMIRGKFFYKELPYTKPLAGRIGNSSFRSDSNGEFMIEQSADKDGVEMTLKGGWKILFPVNGFFPFTKDTDFVWKVYIGKGNEQDNYKRLFKKIEELQKDKVDATLIKAELDTFANQYLSQVDAKILEGIEQQVFLLDNLRLENERKDSLVRAERVAVVTAGKKKTLDLFSKDMRHFVSRALDVEDAFRLKGNKIFKNRNAQVEVAQTIMNYSEAYEELNKNRNVIISGVEEYWEDENRTSDAERLLEYALDDLHKLTMLTANDLIRDVNCVSIKKERKCPRKKSALKSDIERFYRELHYRIDILKGKQDQILEKLKHK